MFHQYTFTNKMYLKVYSKMQHIFHTIQKCKLNEMPAGYNSGWHSDGHQHYITIAHS